MKKIPTLFARDQSSGLVVDEVNPGCEWVLASEGVATRKLDGTCCMVRDGKLFKRHEIQRPGNMVEGWEEARKYPVGWESATSVDPQTGKEQGWVPVGDGPEDKWHRDAWDLCNGQPPGLSDGTYELCGPKVQGNPEHFHHHVLVRHGSESVDCPRDFVGLRDYLLARTVEGIVWHHPDGRMVKIKKRDFVKSGPKSKV